MDGTMTSSTSLTGTREETSVPTQNERYRLISSETRRIILGVLANSESPLTLRELAELVAEREAGGNSVNDGVDRAVIELHHNHLPRIEEAGLIRYDAESNHVDDIAADLNQILEGVSW